MSYSAILPALCSCHAIALAALPSPWPSRAAMHQAGLPCVVLHIMAPPQDAICGHETPCNAQRYKPALPSAALAHAVAQQHTRGKVVTCVRQASSLPPPMMAASGLFMVNSSPSRMEHALAISAMPGPDCGRAHAVRHRCLPINSICTLYSS